jgi:hypothetical protein
MPQQPPNPSPNPSGSTAGPTPPQGAPGPTAGWPTPPAAPPRGYGAPQGYGPAQGSGPAQGTGPAPFYGPVQTPVPAQGQQPTRAFGTSPHGFATPTQPATAVASTAEPKKRDLTINKVIAGAGAAATSAVLGSFFGAMGTVSGAALGSVFSTVVTSFYQHSLDKTRDTVKARVKLPGGRTIDVTRTTEVPAPQTGGDAARTRVYVSPSDDDRPTEVLSAVPAAGAVDAGPPHSRRRLMVMAGFTVVVFALALLAVTGVELLKGSPLNNTGSSGSGTSVGRVLTGGSGTGASDESSDTTESATETDEPGSERTTAARPSAERSAESGSGAGSDDDEPAPTSARNSARSTPTPTPQSDAGSGAGGQAGGGAAESAGPAAAG